MNTKLLQMKAAAMTNGTIELINEVDEMKFIG